MPPRCHAFCDSTSTTTASIFRATGARHERAACQPVLHWDGPSAGDHHRRVDAGINFFFLTADMHWPYYEASRRGLEQLFARQPSVRQHVVVAAACYPTQPEFCAMPFAEVVESVRGLRRNRPGRHGRRLSHRLHRPTTRVRRAPPHPLCRHSSHWGHIPRSGLCSRGDRSWPGRHRVCSLQPRARWRARRRLSSASREEADTAVQLQQHVRVCQPRASRGARSEPWEVASRGHRLLSLCAHETRD